MITFKRVTSINEEEFNRNYEYSRNDLNNGNFPWELYKQITTAKQKKQHIRNLYDETNEQNIIIEVRKDDLLVLLYLGQWHDDELVITLGLTYANPGESVFDWSRSEEYGVVRDEFWESLGINGWTQRTSGLHSNARNFGIVNCAHTIEHTKYPEIPDEYREIFGRPNYDMVDDILRKL